MLVRTGFKLGGSISGLYGHVIAMTGLLGDFINRHTLPPTRHAATCVWKVRDKTVLSRAESHMPG